MLLVSVLAGARGTPSVNVETLASGHPPLANLFRPPGNELKSLTGTFFAVSLKVLLAELCEVIFE